MFKLYFCCLKTFKLSRWEIGTVNIKNKYNKYTPKSPVVMYSLYAYFLYKHLICICAWN